jgi:dihydrofolate synthase/folylpolyglutamate synthase
MSAFSYDEAIRYLDGHINHEKRPSIAAGRVDGLTLDPMRRLLDGLGDPQRSYPVIHLTGTNGKGSVGLMITALLEESGLSVGTYSSPHLQRVNERMQWTGEALLGVGTDGEVTERTRPAGGGPIDDDSFGRVMGEVADVEVLVGVQPTYFDLVTAAAFTWFAELPVDVAVVEVGLLGRFDATNVIDAQVAVITNIGHDHSDYEGDWRAKIADEKAGIVKAESFLVLGEGDPLLRPIFDQAADGRLWVRGEDFGVDNQSLAVGGRLIDVRTPTGVIDDVFLPAHGEHQADNAAVGVAAVEAFFGRSLDAELVRSAFARLVLPGRFEVVQHNPLVVIDGAHNIEGANADADARREFEIEGRTIMVLGMLTGRDPNALLDAFELDTVDLVVATTPTSPRALPAEQLAALVDERGVEVSVIDDVVVAVESALTIADADDMVVVTGSMYTAGEARDVFAPAEG